MAAKARQPTAFLVAIAVLMSSAAGTAVARDRRYAWNRVEDRLLYISSGNLMDKLALSYDTLLYPLLDLTTSLDPNFMVAYRFGAIFLSEPDPGGAGRPELAIALLEKGVKTNPDKWEYYHD